MAAAVRTVEGQDKQDLIVTVPIAYSLDMPPGIRIKIDGDEPISLQYAGCTPKSCQAQVELTNQVLDRMRKGNQMLVAAINMQQKPLTFRILLNGFAITSDGAAVDEVKYRETRARAMEFGEAALPADQSAGERSGGISAACPAYHDNSDAPPDAGTAIKARSMQLKGSRGCANSNAKNLQNEPNCCLQHTKRVGVRQPSSRASHTRAARNSVLAVPVEGHKSRRCFSEFDC